MAVSSSISILVLIGCPLDVIGDLYAQISTSGSKANHMRIQSRRKLVVVGYTNIAYILPDPSDVRGAEQTQQELDC